jgi:hypothetical protein
MHKPVGVALVLTLAILLSVSAGATAGTSTAVDVSGITAVNVDAVEVVGEVRGVPYSRYAGTVEGRVAPDEKVVGLGAQPVDADGFVTWSAEFEAIRPTDGARFGAVVVEATNRGAPLFPLLVNGPASETEPFGDGLLFEGRGAYARVQWQTGIAPGIPDDAQGIGLVALRDFGRLLRAGATVDGQPTELGRYDTAMLVGWSQAAWMVDTLVAEGFNVDPQRRGRGVYDGAIALDGAGNWLAINELGDDGAPQEPYARPDGVPLRPAQLLTRPATDPLFVDIANYTDFYRLRASVSDRDVPAKLRRLYRRYDWPAAHAPGSIAGPAVVFGSYGCNGGTEVPLNPIDFRPYLRALFASLIGQVTQGRGAEGLPLSKRFALGPEPPASPLFNGLPGQVVRVPRVDRDAQPVGGVRFVDIEVPLGRPDPVSLPPVSTTSITDVCGNFGGYEPFTAAELQTRYGTLAEYTTRVEHQVDRLVEGGYLLAEDRASVLATRTAAFQAAA